MTLTDGLLSISNEWHMVEIGVPTLQGETTQVDGVARINDSSYIDLQIFPTIWPVPDFDPHGKWHLLCDQGLHFVNITAHPEKVDHPRHIRLRIEYHVTRDHMRQNLRIETEIYMAWWKGKKTAIARPQPFRTHVSLSRQGLSFTTDEELSVGEVLNLHLILPGPTLETLQCKAQILSIGQTTKKGRKTALKIVHIMPEDVEKISLFCLAEHFRNMQAKNRRMALMLDPQ